MAPIEEWDTGNFQKFYNFLLECQSITGSKEWNPPDTPDLICILLSKLFEKIRDKRVRAVRNKESQ